MLVPFAELGGDDGVTARLGGLGGKVALADAGRAHDPEETVRAARTTLWSGSPLLLKQPLASVEAFAQQLAVAGLGLDAFEMAVERFDR